MSNFDGANLSQTQVVMGMPLNAIYVVHPKQHQSFLWWGWYQSTIQFQKNVLQI